MQRSRAVLTWSVLAAALLCAGCSSPSALPADASAAELGRAFGACGAEGTGDTGSPIHTVAGTEEWVAAVALNADQRPESGVRKTSDVEVQTAAGDKKTVRLHSSFWPGIEWALKNDATVWLAMADPEYWVPGTVEYVLIETAAGEVFFPGECLDVVLRIPLENELAPDSDAVLAGLPLVAPGEVKEYLGIEEVTPEEPGPDRRILNPDDVDASVLEPLTLIGMRLTTNGAIGDGTFTICTRIPDGWNECVMADDQSVEGWNVNAYIDDSGKLEFWLLNADADVSQPLGKIGEIDVPGSGFDVFVDTSKIGADGAVASDDLVTLID